VNLQHLKLSLRHGLQIPACCTPIAAYDDVFVSGVSLLDTWLAKGKNKKRSIKAVANKLLKEIFGELKKMFVRQILL